MKKGSAIERLAIVGILALGAAFAFVGMDWDEGSHLHPDERFLTMVATAMSWPESLADYFDESKSTLNPRNVGHAFFAYGTLPTTLVKGVSIATGRTGYEDVYLVGRFLSGAAFIGTILFLFLVAGELYNDRRVALLAALLLATCVLPIQNAHFFTVDSFCVFFVTGAVLWLAKISNAAKVRYFVLLGLFFGMALASKLSVSTFVVVVIAVAVALLFQRMAGGRAGPPSPSQDLDETNAVQRRSVLRICLSVFGLFSLSGALTFLAFRVCQPDAFSGPGFWGLSLSERWLENMRQASLLVGGEIDTPPGHQWTNRTPLWFPWTNMVVWGMGLPLGLSAWFGWGAAAWRLIYKGRSAHLIPVLWVVILFLHQGTQWVKSMRYFLPIYPMLALLAAWLLVRVWDRTANWLTTEVGSSRLWRPALRGCVLLVPFGNFLWACAFSSIYFRPHTRIEATEWIRENLPNGSVLANEHWDDALPLPRPGFKPSDHYEMLKLEWYDEDTPFKLAQTLARLEKVDYVILSSNRLYDSIPRLPMRYPMTVAYYETLFDGRLGFERAAEFVSYPRLLGWEFPDQGAEEAFTVYDHPRVQIFKKTPEYSTENTMALLGDVDWCRILRLTPKQASRLSAEEIERLRGRRSRPPDVGYGRSQPREILLPDTKTSDETDRK